MGRAGLVRNKMWEKLRGFAPEPNSTCSNPRSPCTYTDFFTSPCFTFPLWNGNNVSLVELLDNPCKTPRRSRDSVNANLTITVVIIMTLTSSLRKFLNIYKEYFRGPSGVWETFSLWASKWKYSQVKVPRKEICGLGTQILTVWLSLLIGTMGDAHSFVPGVLQIWVLIKQSPPHHHWEIPYWSWVYRSEQQPPTLIAYLKS